MKLQRFVTRTLSDSTSISWKLQLNRTCTMHALLTRAPPLQWVWMSLTVSWFMYARFGGGKVLKPFCGVYVMYTCMDVQIHVGALPELAGS